MSQREKTEAGVRPPEAHPCGEHGSQTKAQRLSAESFRCRLRSKSPLYNFKEGFPDMLDSSSSEEEAADVGSVQPPDPQSFMRRHRRKSKSPLLNFKEGSSHISDTESRASSTAMDVPKLPTAIRKRDEVIQETNVGSGTEILLKHQLSGTSAGQPAADTRLVLQQEQQLQELRKQLQQRDRQRERKMQLRELRLRPEGPYMDSGLIHHHPFLSADPHSMRRHRRKSISPPLDFKEGSSHMKRDEVIQEKNVGSGTEILLKHQLSGTSADWPVVDTRLVLQQEQKLQEREQQLRVREQLQELRKLQQRDRQRERKMQLRELRLRLDSSSSEEEAADVGSVQPPDPQPEDPYMDSGLIHHHPFQPPFPPTCTSETSSDSGVSMKSDKSNDRLINFSLNSKDPSVDPEADDDGSVQPPDPPPGDPDMDSGLIHHHPFLSADPPKRDEVIQETNDGSGTETLLKNPPSWTSADWPVVDTRLVLQREQQLREQKLWEQQLLLLLRLRLDSDSSSEEEKEKEMMRRSRTEDF